MSSSIFLLSLSLMLLSPSKQVTAAGGIVTDGTVGLPGYAGSSHTLTPIDNKVIITQSMGSTSGHNLFQSFSEFNIAKGQTVTFTEDQQGFIDNVIARVTGKDVSNINGTLEVTPKGHANFYLLNPNGVLFGNGAQIDVPGDFHVTTASYVKFQDGAKFGADPVTSKLSAANPSAFGFSASNHNNNALIGVSDGANLSTKNSNTAIDLVGANIKVASGGSINAVTDGSEIRVIAAKAGADVSVLKEANGYLPLPKHMPTKHDAGYIDLTGGGTIQSIGSGLSRIAGWAYGVDIHNGSLIQAESNASYPLIFEDGIHINSSFLDIHDDKHDISGGGGIISNSMGAGLGNSIYLTIRDGIRISRESYTDGISGIGTISSADGAAGSIYISAGQIAMTGNRLGSSANIASLSLGNGGSGNVYVNSQGAIKISNSSYIFTNTMDGGVAGSVNVKTHGLLDISNDSYIGSAAYSPETKADYGVSGDVSVSAGNIVIKSTNKIGPDQNTGITNINNSRSGSVGDINVYSSGNIIIKGGYKYSQNPTEAGSHVTGIYGLSGLTESNTEQPEINVKAEGKLILNGSGGVDPSGLMAVSRFNNASLLTGIESNQISGANGESSADLYSINVNAGHGVSMINAAIIASGFVSKANNPPIISVLSGGTTNLYKSDIGSNLASSGYVSKASEASVTLTSNGLALRDSSVFTDLPGSGINIISNGGVFMQSKDIATENGKIPDFSVFYGATYGTGNINISSRSNLFILNSTIGSFSGASTNNGITLNIKLKSDTITMGRSAIFLGGNLDQVDINKSSIQLETNGLFPLFNVINKGLYINSVLYPNIKPTYPKGFNNLIAKLSDSKSLFDFSLSGSLFGISGMMPELSPPAFESNKLGNACEAYKKGALILEGRGQNKSGFAAPFN